MERDNYCICTTRFNSLTWEENKIWRETHYWKGCIYGSPLKVKYNIPSAKVMYVLEMHNNQNKVIGVGIVKNILSVDKYYRIYSDENYNRYIYKSIYRIDRAELTPKEEKIIQIFDVLLFKGAMHLKRGQGLTSLPKWMKDNKHIDFVKFLKELFTNRFIIIPPASEETLSTLLL